MELVFFALLAAAAGLGVGIIFATRKGLDADIAANEELKVEIQEGLVLLARRQANGSQSAQVQDRFVQAGAVDPGAPMPVEAALPSNVVSQSASSEAQDQMAPGTVAASAATDAHDDEGEDKLLSGEPSKRTFVREYVNPTDGKLHTEVITLSANDFELDSMVLSRKPSPPIESSPVQPLAGASDEYLTFRLGFEEYGIDITTVQEIRSFEQPTRIANAPEFIRGIINLRGVGVPVVDLRLRLNYPSIDDSSTAVIILNVMSRLVGAVVDSVSDVLVVDRNSIRPAPKLGAASVDTSFTVGVAMVGERVLLLMDIDRLMINAGVGLIDATMAV